MSVPLEISAYYQLLSAMGKEAMRRKKAQGELMHLAPLGYKNERINGRSVKMIDLSTWKLLEQARQLRKDGWSVRRICAEMARQGLRSKRGNRIGPSGMFRLLSNKPVYNGSVG